MKIAFLTLLVIGVAAASESIVLVLAPVEPIPALSKVDNESFNRIAKPLVKDHMIAVFQEDDLSFSDFQCKSNRTGQQSCYSHLQTIKPSTFYMRVDSPENVLEKLDPNYEVITISKNGKLETPLKCKTGKVVFLRFSEGTGLSREDTLEAHDIAISNVMKQVSCPTVFMYTSTPAKDFEAKKRSRRALSVWETAAPKGGIIFTDPKFQIFFTTLAVKIGSAAPKAITISNMKIDDHNTTDFSVTLSSSDAADVITFVIELKKGYYYMKQLTYNKDTQFRSNDINAPPAFSYFCGNLTVYSPNGNQLLWNSVQFQAPFGSKVKTVNEKYFEFGESWNCVGFVTHPILAGLFVSAILLAILFVGICWMMDINTMDRFDDPKGKTITINASE
ncbi:V-type proton ATPase subunit S1 [Zeugodacus cucurbitae]|uniref:V-type proton ATPase subunit S1 n=1 Tax=Zeugodacus cucurbitae TaxID=28588 RepID=UPI0023D930E9|nr:V-type proton ATPase subunit S1 [Zeugodacus cucurbitae]